MKRAIPVVVLGLLALTACGEKPSVQGTVTEKEYEKAVWQFKQEPVHTDRCTTNRGQRTCSRHQTGTRQVHVLTRPECYELELDSGWEGCVSRKAYEALNVGDKYDSRTQY